MEAELPAQILDHSAVVRFQPIETADHGHAEALQTRRRTGGIRHGDPIAGRGRVTLAGMPRRFAIIEPPLPLYVPIHRAFALLGPGTGPLGSLGQIVFEHANPATQRIAISEP
ncbi:MAG TPA: hypothetical protein VLI39_19540 [Sedimentisphaerales bacterium]|nr:hypothetical protein [Sedimentisphaerales bacterium]